MLNLDEREESLLIDDPGVSKVNPNRPSRFALIVWLNPLAKMSRKRISHKLRI
jgi:hypothetical protein